jgi:hypothetical protein
VTRDEYIEECQGLIDSFDDHVDTDDVVRTLRMMADRIDAEGLDAPIAPAATPG